MRRVTLWTILSLALTLRLAVLAIGLRSGGALLTPDSAGYIDTARTLATHGRFATGPDEPPELARTPGYPLLLAALWRATAGDTRIASAPRSAIVPAAALAQCAMDAILVYLTYILGCRLSGRTAGLLAAAFQAAAAVAVAASVRVLSDGVFSLLLTVAVLCLLRYMRGGRWPAIVASAAVLAAAAYVRPIALLAPLPIGVVLGRRHMRKVAAFAGVFAACIAPWIVRNYVTAGYPGFSAITSVNLYYYNSAAVRARQEGVGEDQMRRKMRREFQEDATGDTPAEQYLWQGNTGIRTCVRDPLTAIVVHLEGCLAGLLPGATDVLEAAGVTQGQRGTLGVLKRDGPRAAARHYFSGNWAAAAMMIPSGLLLAVVYLGVLITSGRKLRFRMSARAWLLLLIVAYFLLTPGPASHPRFRAPIMPLLNAVAAAGWVWVASRRRPSRGNPQ